MTQTIDRLVVSSTREALAELGVTENSLSPDEIAAVDRDGFVLLRDMIDPDWLHRLRGAYERLMREKYGELPPQRATNDDYWNHEAGTRRLTNLVSADPVFDGMYTHPRLLAAVARILGDDFVLNSLNARDALPGQGAQEFHRDVDDTTKWSGTPYTVNTAWLLDDFTVENGATRFVPGSHRWNFGVETLPDRKAPHPAQVIPEAPAGSVVVFNADVWHSGTLNTTRSTRRVVHCAFSIPSVGQKRDKQKDLIRKSTYDRISPAARRILDV